MQPGDLIFYTGIYYKETMKKQKHNLVHVEIFLGGETGEQSIASRWQNGVIQIFDSFKFVSKGYHSIEWHYRSIDTWLEGVCRSWCSEHPWAHSKITWAPGKKSIFNTDEEDEDMNAPGMEDDDPQSEKSDLFFIG